MSDIQLGDKFLLEPTGNYKHTKDRTAFPYEVVNIGRKYFYVAPKATDPKHLWVKIEKETMTAHCGDHNAGYRIWADAAAFQENITYEEHLSAIKDYFRSVTWSNRYTELSYEHCEEVYNLLSKNGYLQSE